MKKRGDFSNKNILITGGTGSIGKIIVKKLLLSGVKSLTIFSRDEQKHFALQHELEHPKNARFLIGDIRDHRTVHMACRGIDIIFHAAAMKHVPICEEDPFEAVKTNVIGAYNLRQAAIENNVEKVIIISTDKAVRPINVMGMTKALQERITLAENNHRTDFIGVRFGNVLGSLGSVIPLFIQKIKEGKPIPLTNSEMTRFILPTGKAVDLVFQATHEGNHGEIFVKKMPACSIQKLTEAIISMYSADKNYPIKITGLRKGEQVHEALVSDEEMRRVKEYRDHFVIAPAWTKEKKKNLGREYNSQNSEDTLGKEDLVKMLRQLEPFITMPNPAYKGGLDTSSHASVKIQSRC